MKEKDDLERYSVIIEKNPREIVLLRGSGCAWRRCTFCDYHLDFSKKEEENYKLNCQELDKVTGMFNHLEVINSGSFQELDEKTMEKIFEVCKKKEIRIVHFEAHWMYRDQIAAYREKFRQIGVQLKIKIGVETFDYQYREEILKKGLATKNIEEIQKYFDEVCLLQGLAGQTVEGMKADIELGLKYFERVCVNVMVENTTKIKPDQAVIKSFVEKVYPLYKDNDRVDILLENTEFGVGGKKNE